MIERRIFLKLVGSTAAVAIAMARRVFGANQSNAPGQIEPSNSPIPRRTLGKTGERVSIVGIGGHHLGRAVVEESESIRIVRTALDSGVNFLDNSWDYNNGESEVRVGKALRDNYRDKAFLMTKIDGRDKASAAKQIDESLQRLQTDRIDLVQFHEVIRMNDPNRIFASGGAIEAALEAKKAGKLRYIGFTGHKSSQIHLHMLQTADRYGFTFDTVQMPLNVMDAHFDSFEQMVLPELVKRRIGVLALKTMGDGNFLRSGIVTPLECLHYAMNLPTSVVITGCDSMRILEQALDAARTFSPLTDAEREALLAKTEKIAATGGFELYKTSQTFDSTSTHPEWLG
jgi:aryl-alcohol dehydrogenase-like predicted oxidoreductase